MLVSCVASFLIADSPPIAVDKSHFRQVSARDSAMAEALNADYLSQLFIKPSPEATDGK